jgi:CheY-like chemotaxis protein/HPt (histidine-containing phosphotransfer) domain-containing protein
MQPAAQSLRILIADDAAANLRFAAKLFGDRGHQICLAQNGREALELFAAQPCDAVLMDIHMPDVDGPTATSAIRGGDNDRSALVPIIGISAFTALADRRQYLLSGMDGFLSRPVEVDQLLQVVEGLGAALLAAKFTAHAHEINDRGAASANAPQVLAIDGPTALLRCGGDCDLFRQVVAAFEQRATSLLADIRDAVIAQRPDLVRANAMSLARLAATSAAGQLLHKCQELAAAAETPSWRGLTTRLSGLAGEIEMAARELGCFSATLSSDSISV